MADINIAFASTGYGPLWAPAVSSWLGCIAYTARNLEIQHVGKVGGAGVTDRCYTHSAENFLVKNFLALEETTHLFLTESDMVLPKDAIVKLLALDKDLASGVYFLRTDVREAIGQPCLYKRPVAIDPTHAYAQHPVSIFPTEEPFRVDCAGLGCLLVKRHVFEKLKWPWFDLKEDLYGSDMYFYKHAHDAGFELWVDPTVRCGQVDYYETTIDDWHWQMQNNPQFGKSGFIIGTGEANGKAASA